MTERHASKVSTYVCIIVFGVCIGCTHTHYFDGSSSLVVVGDNIKHEVADHIDGYHPASYDKGEQFQLSFPEQRIQTVEYTEHWERGQNNK